MLLLASAANQHLHRPQVVYGQVCATTIDSPAALSLVRLGLITLLQNAQTSSRLCQL